MERWTVGDVEELLVQGYRRRLRAQGGGLTTRQAGAAIGVSESSIKRWCDAGKLRCTVGGGGHRRVSAEALAELLNTEEFAGRLTPPDSPIPYRVVGVDLAAKEGDATVRTVMQRNPDGTTSLVSSEPMSSVSGIVVGPGGEVSAITGQVAPKQSVAMSEHDPVELDQ